MVMYNPPHAGEVIADILDEMNVGVREFAKALHVAPSTAHRLLTGKTAVTPEMAVRLSSVIGSSPKFWLNIQDNYSLFKVEKEIDVSLFKRLAPSIEKSGVDTA